MTVFFLYLNKSAYFFKSDAVLNSAAYFMRDLLNATVFFR
jgi:hypothetical protein